MTITMSDNVLKKFREDGNKISLNTRAAEANIGDLRRQEILESNAHAMFHPEKRIEGPKSEARKPANGRVSWTARFAAISGGTCAVAGFFYVGITQAVSDLSLLSMQSGALTGFVTWGAIGVGFGVVAGAVVDVVGRIVDKHQN
jgi:hypothetical protein